MQFILENYLLIVLVGLFFVFALIGYLIDMLRKVNDTDKVDTDNSIKSIEIAELDDIKDEIEDENIETEELDDSDDLLNSYDNDEI